MEDYPTKEVTFVIVPSDLAGLPPAGVRVAVRPRRGRAVLQGRVVSVAEPALLRIELEAAAGLRRRARVELEWIEPAGVVHCHGRVSGAWGQLVEVGLEEAPRLVQRRDHVRRDIELAVTGWTLLEPTRRLVGRTLNLSGGGAFLELPGLAPAAVVIELRIALPDGQAAARGNVLRREPGDRVGVAFAPLESTVRERIVGLVVAAG